MSDQPELEALRDPVLQRALDNAPDQAAEPNRELRRRIQKAARRAVQADDENINLDESIWRIWWRRLFGGSGGRTRWSATFATLLIASFATLLWHRELPEARLDGERAAARIPASPALPESTTPAAPESSTAPPAVAAEPSTAAPDSSGQAGAASPPLAAEMPSNPAPAPEQAPPAPAPGAPAPAAGAGPGPGPGPAAPAPGAVAPPLARQESQPGARVPSPGRAGDDLPADEVRENESTAKAAAAPPPLAPPSPPAATPLTKPAPPPLASPSPSAPAPAVPPLPAAPAADPTRPAGATDRRAAERVREEAAAAPPQRTAPPIPPTQPTQPAPRSQGSDAPPTFAALSQWRRVTILRTDGASRNLSRDEAGELVPLLGSAALVAVTAQPLPDAVEWRVVLERANGDRIAVLDLAGNWVRWREGRAPAGTGAPSAGAVAALREALRQALER